MRTFLVGLLLMGYLACSGCIKPKITLFPEETEPLKEHTLQGEGKEKILVIPIKGTISDSRKGLALQSRPSTVQEVVSQLNCAKKDKHIKALLLKIDSPGGSVTASDMLYHEIVKYKEHSGAKIVVVMMGVAASGGYYISLPADYIFAHPTTITGSIGVVFLRPNVTGLMSKIGLDIEVDKSGRNKDMGSPFRNATDEERQIMQKAIDDLAERFITLVVTHRELDDQARKEISSARVYSAKDALQLGLVDQIGYLDDAIRKASQLAGLPDNGKVVVYRRTEYPDDNLYNTSTRKPQTPEINLIDTGLADVIPPFHAGFYYLWLPGRSE